MKILVLILALVVCASCQSTIHLAYVWDKNPASDGVKDYDLFLVYLPDSAAFWQLTDWPVDTLSQVKLDSTKHMPNLLATMAHIYSPIDTMVYEFNKPRSQMWVRGYITAADSAGNVSFMAPSINVTYIGDDIPPGMVGRNFVFKR
jgi:hypothetical protein